MPRDEWASNRSRFVPALGRLGTRFYDPLVRSTAREVRFKERLLDFAAIGLGERVLDLGCGTGTLAIRACQRQPAARVVGIDADPRMIERARRKAHAAGVELELQPGSATDLPYADRSCDVVLSSLLFHHLGRDAKRAAADEIARVLVPGGRVVIADWGAPTDPLMRVLFLTVQLVDGFETTRDNVEGRLPAMLSAAGLVDVRERATYRTVYGSLVLLQAHAPAGEADATEAITRLGERRYTWPQLCELARVEHPVADRLWRALGFPDVAPDAPVYTEEDVRALTIAAEGLERLSGADRDAAVEMIVREARGVSGHLARIVEIQVATLDDLGRLGLRQRAVAQALERGIEHSDLGWLLFYALRRRLDETLRRRASTENPEHPVLAVGFVDLVDFTQTTRGLQEDALSAMLARFESLTWDVVTEAGGQVIKLIGDEAMLVWPSVTAAASAALEIIDTAAASQLPPARAGLAVGPLLPRGGDYFGLAVNLASRLVDRAEAGTVVVDERFKAALGNAFALEPLGRQPLKGIGETAAWRIRPTS
jgi:class 3 adenylate cyclase/SAM-dependent methyltransferase